MVRMYWVTPIIIVSITKEMITRTLALVQAEEETVNTSGILFLLVISAAKVTIIIIRIHDHQHHHNHYHHHIMVKP